MDAMFDRMDAVGKSVLGLSVACAQCHNHKFDPLSQREYYRLFAFLNNDHEAQRVVYAPHEQMKVARSRVPNIEPRRALLRCENAERVGTAFLRNRDFGAGIIFESLGERFTPGQWNGTEQVEPFLRRVGPKRRAHSHDSGEHAKRAQRYRHGSLPSFSLIRLRP